MLAGLLTGPPDGRHRADWEDAMTDELAVARRATDCAFSAKRAHPQDAPSYCGDGSVGTIAFDMKTANRFGAPSVEAQTIYK
jgi:hypothetical protein